jgi:hypothetical protein
MADQAEFEEAVRTSNADLLGVADLGVGVVDQLLLLYFRINSTTGMDYTPFDLEKEVCVVVVVDRQGQSRKSRSRRANEEDALAFSRGQPQVSPQVSGDVDSYRGLAHPGFPVGKEELVRWGHDKSKSLQLLSANGEDLFVVDAKGLSCYSFSSRTASGHQVAWPGDWSEDIQFDFVRRVIELQPGILVVWVTIWMREWVDSAPGRAPRLLSVQVNGLVSFNWNTKTATELCSRDTVFDQLDSPYFFPIKAHNWFLHADTKGLCVRDGISGQEVFRVLRPDGKEITRHSDQVIAVTDEMILVVDPGDDDAYMEGETFIEHYAYTLPDKKLHTLEVQLAVSRAYKEPAAWLHDVPRHYVGQTTDVFGIGPKSFAMSHKGVVNFVTFDL